MDKVDETSHDVNNLYNLTTSLATSLSYHQLILYIRSVLANLQDSLSYIRMVSTHTMDYIDAAMTGTLCPHILPIMDLKKMLPHIEETLPSTLHLPVSSKDTLHFYWYLCMHVLITNKQFLLLINVPIQDQSKQLSIYKIFTSEIPHGNFTAHYDINTQYLGSTQDETMAVEISPQQFRICQEANGQFCNIPTPFQPLANPPSCITALYTKTAASISTRCSLQIWKSSDVSMPSQLAPNVWILTTAPSTRITTITLICLGETTKFNKVKKPIQVLQLPTACSATSLHFHLPPMLWNYIFGSKYIFGYGKSPHDQHFITRLLHMATFGEAPEWESATILGQHTLSSSRTTLQTQGHRRSTYYTFFTWRVNRRYRFNLDTVFTYRSLCNGYRIAYTSRFWEYFAVISFGVDLPD